jgi:hypothetical protein
MAPALQSLAGAVFLKEMPAVGVTESRNRWQGTKPPLR